MKNTSSHRLDNLLLSEDVKSTLTLRRGQGADNLRRPSSDAGGFNKREHAYLVLNTCLVLISPSWWMGVEKDKAFAAGQADSAMTVRKLREQGWRIMAAKFTHPTT